MPQRCAKIEVAALDVSVPRRALRGHAPPHTSYISMFSDVSVPRRALRGHAPGGGFERRAQASFSAPKGVERACPLLAQYERIQIEMVSVPRRALRGHAPYFAPPYRSKM